MGDQEQNVHEEVKRTHLFLALFILAAVIGFWKSYLSILSELPEHLTVVFHVHAFTMLLWLLMLVAQPWFIRTGRVDLHRLIGRSSFVVAPAIIIFGLAATHAVFNRSPEGLDRGVATLNVLAFGQLLAFGVCWGLGIYYRKRDTAWHMRFMISTAFAASTAIFFRIFIMWIPGFGTLDRAAAGNLVALTLPLFVLIGQDWRHGIKRSPYWVVTVLIGFMHLAYWTFAKSDWWYGFCLWFASLGG